MTANTMSDLSKNVYTMSLDEALYNLDQEERDFFKNETGIQGDDELKAHIIAIQTKAYSELVRFTVFQKGYCHANNVLSSGCMGPGVLCVAYIRAKRMESGALLYYFREYSTTASILL